MTLKRSARSLLIVMAWVVAGQAGLAQPSTQGLKSPALAAELQRVMAENIFWALCHKIMRIAGESGEIPEELEALEKQLSDTYFCNFSVFQSLPDSWAIDQLFPIMPIHRLNERPTRQAVLADITCDSDGKIEHFIDKREVKDALELHPLNNDDYYLGIFLVGAYQEILGDLHNLFGDTHAVRVPLGPNGGYLTCRSMG